MNWMLAARMGGMDAAEFPIVCGAIIFGGALGLLVGAMLLRAAAAWVTKIELGFGQACLIVLVAGIINFAINLVAGFAVSANAWRGGAEEKAFAALVLQFISAVMGFFVASAVSGAMIKYPETGEVIGFGKGVLLTLVQFAIVIAIALVVGAMYAVATKLMG